MTSRPVAWTLVEWAAHAPPPSCPDRGGEPLVRRRHAGGLNEWTREGAPAAAV